MLTFIGIGSNLQDPLRQVVIATESLAKLSDVILLSASSCYQSSPLGPADQPDFINRVVSIDTTLSPGQLLDTLQGIENQQGRVRSTRWGSRLIDLDILLYGDQIISTPRLIVPHEGLKQRGFFLYPLAEIAPELILPSGEKIVDLLIDIPHITKLTEQPFHD